LDRAFEGDYKLHFHVGAWPFGRTDPKTGKPLKREVGPWMLGAFGALAKLRFLRGGLLDPFRNSPERRLERELLAQYEGDVEMLLGMLDARTHPTAVRLASLPETVRGYGHVKEANATAAAKEREQLIARLREPASEAARAA
jgi:indolepyruvate ferredoxin oxidoreductase